MFARMPGIFVNYRRDDAPGVAGRLYDHLAKNFSRHDLFIDVDAIKPGLDFVKQLDTQVSQCDVVLALIGPNWLKAADEQGRQRLHGDKDYVRIEIASALKRDIPVIPVLVDGAHMPSEEELPEDLKSLTRRQALELRHTRFAADAGAIVAALKDGLPKRRKRWPFVLLAACLVAALSLGSAYYFWRWREPSPSLVLTGVYRLSETDSSGNKDPGILAVTDEGFALVLTRWTKGVVGHGVGHLTGGKLAVDWGTSGPTSYIVGAKGIMVGSGTDGSTAETAEPIAFSSIKTASSLEGTYTAEGRNPDGSHYAGVVTISKQQNTYHLSWKVGSSNYEGNGELRGNVLIVNWGDSTPVVYAVCENGRLVGLWNSGQGEETLIPSQ
jgi:hypothetical protein